ncbi:hypothetical protein ABWH93_09165 [Seohaeicola saemankumensis]|uniref:hypothetical protein n=1 Tax=Seohaeicola TaxID=481178 RepID=UPI0035CE8948
MDNLQKSQLIMAKILEKSMEAGVQEWTLKFDDLDLEVDFASFFYPCLEWLESEGLIRVGAYWRTLDGPASGDVQNVHLTSFGQAALRREVQINGNVEKVSETVRKISKEPASYSRFGDFLGSVLGGFTKSISS